MSFLGVTLNSTNQNVSSIPTVRRREVESFEAEQMPPPMCHSSMNKNKKSNEEQEPLERVSTANSNSLPPPENIRGEVGEVFSLWSKYFPHLKI